ncbi:hypothetical protein C2R22_24380 (plasmid) [Salinigranum rubrum]|uniref:Capsule synthesis protein CapA domain-containing protein n=1 Tax=Salinigranum rubrum TaxID=755307 RepID=A0A2I8VRY2_9EURY|nr:CapA family protein [Salinigranum rubrum]AUV84667.1 hypothetical protein C2R22_24380 [Salinigranum rubrum]
MTYDVALSGDSLLNRRISVIDEPDFRSIIELFQNADIGYTHLETSIYDYDDDEMFPVAEAGGTWQRAPPFVAEELKWAGFDIVSHASNHALDGAYGGLYSTWEALDEIGIPYAGTGMDLGEARAPAYLDTEVGRVGLVSMATSFQRWARAGEARSDFRGRPGVNPLRYNYEVGPEELEEVKKLGEKMGWWITNLENSWLLHPPGLHNTLFEFIERDEPGMEMVPNEDDREGNLRSIRDASRQSDLAMAHLHIHEWKPEEDPSVSPDWVPEFARDSVDAGADIVIVQGSHAPFRGIEAYDDSIIFYDLGDFFLMSNTVEKLPADYYTRWRRGLEVHRKDATPSEGYDARPESWGVVHPPGGYRSHSPVLGNIVPVCEMSDDGDVLRVELHPALMGEKALEGPVKTAGLPMRATGQKAQKIVEHIDALSQPYDTEVTHEDGVGVITFE